MMRGVLTHVSTDNPIENIIGKISIEKQVLYVGEECNNRICVVIRDDEIEEQFFVELYKQKDGVWELDDNFYDSGLLEQNGDEIVNDGIYSNFFDFSGEKEGVVKCRIVVRTNSKQLECADFSIAVKNNLNDEDFEEYFNVNNSLKEYADQVIKNGDSIPNIEDIIDEITGLFKDRQISSIDKVDEWTVKIGFESGLVTYLQFTDESDMELMRRGSEADIPDDSIVDNIPDEEDDEDENAERVGSEWEFDLESVEISDTRDFVLSNQVLLWAPFDTEWGDNDETEIVKQIVETSPYGLKLDIVNDENADIDSLKKISEYGLVILATHGLEGKWIVTGEDYLETKKYCKELQSGELSVYISAETNNGSTDMRYMVNASWFDQNIDQTFPNSIVINNSCSSLQTDDFWKIFNNLGAATYYGYSGTVTNDYVIVQTYELLYNLVYFEKTTGEAYDYSYDTQYGGEYFGIRGVSNLSLPCGLMNGNFENELSGWEVNGDGRTISKLGSIAPTQGNSMAIISTGLGYTQERGEINQTFCVPESATKLSFDWNFLSEEFLEYIGSGFDDPFKVVFYLTDETNEEVILLDMDVNSIANDFDANEEDGGKLIHVSPEISFDRGDVWMTGWQNVSIEISEYAGQKVKLSFSVQDALDTIYTTAVLVDNISFDNGNVSPDQPICVSEEYSDEVIRGKFLNNKTGNSYIFYNGYNFSTQAKFARKRIRYKNGYKKIDQVELIDARTEKSFVNEWKNMSSGKANNVIDDVYLIYHGTYYAIMIDEENQENLTTSPEGIIGSEDNATYIRSLKKHNIKCITILSCNAGLLDAINLNTQITVRGKKFVVKGNVAQAFLDSQNVEKIKAWDGSVTFDPIYYTPILSTHQEHFREKLEALKEIRCYVPKRGTYITGKVNIHTGVKKPKGQITYYRTDGGKMYCRYSYRVKQALDAKTISQLRFVKVRLKDFAS